MVAKRKSKKKKLNWDFAIWYLAFIYQIVIILVLPYLLFKYW